LPVFLHRLLLVFDIKLRMIETQIELLESAISNKARVPTGFIIRACASPGSRSRSASIRAGIGLSFRDRGGSVTPRRRAEAPGQPQRLKDPISATIAGSERAAPVIDRSTAIPGPGGGSNLAGVQQVACAPALDSSNLQPFRARSRGLVLTLSTTRSQGGSPGGRPRSPVDSVGLGRGRTLVRRASQEGGCGRRRVLALRG
jgi:hypothetical protein